MRWTAEFQTASDRADQRHAPRRRLCLEVAAHRSVEGVSAIIHNLSTKGLLIETGEKLEPEGTFEVALPEAGATEVRIAWTSGNFYGCEFTAPISPGTVSAAVLRAHYDITPLPEAEPAPRLPLSHGYGKARRDLFAGQAQGNPKLSLRSRISILFGLSLLLWAIIALAIWDSFF